MKYLAKLSYMLIVVILVAGVFSPASARQITTDPIPPSGHGFFIQNVGQFHGGEYLLRTESADYWISPREIRVTQTAAVQMDDSTSELRQESFVLEFAVSSLDAVIEPFGLLESTLSYMLGSDPAGWYLDVPVWSGLRVHGLYEGIDLILAGADPVGGLDWFLKLESGVDPAVVKLVATNGQAIAPQPGGIELQGELGTIRLSLPATDSLYMDAFLASGDELTVMESLSTDTIEASIGEIQANRSINYLGYLGGSGIDRALNVSVENGYAYVTGSTQSVDFPVTAGVVDTTLEITDAFVAKINSSGTGLVYATYLGGAYTDIANDIEVENGIVYITGKTNSLSFPGMDPWENRDDEVFVVSLNPNGTGIRYAKRFGGLTDSDRDEAFGIAVEAGNAYVTGFTESPTFNGVETILKGDIFALKLDPTGNPLYTRIFGGNGLDVAYDVAVSGGTAYLTGESESKPFVGVAPAGFEAFVMKLNSVGLMEWKTVLGGSGTDLGNAIVVDNAGSIYITGTTNSANFLGSLPSLLPYAGLDDGHIVRLSSSGAVNYRTFLGGAGHDRAFALAVDTFGGIQVIGETSSANFPVSGDAFQSVMTGSTDGFLARIVPGSNPELDFSSYLGGASLDAGRGIALDINGAAFICGETSSSDLPVTGSIFDGSYNGNQDGFVAKMAIGPIPGIFLEASTNSAEADTPPGPTIPFGGVVNWTYWIANTGPMELTNVVLTDSMIGSVTCPKSTLALGESMTCTASGTAIVGQYSNVGSVEANPPGGLPPVTANDPSHYFGAQPSIQIVKKTNGVNSNTAPGPDILIGSTVTWTYDVTNTGNVPLTNVVVEDSDSSLVLACTATTLAAQGSPGSSLSCTATGIAVRGNYENTATVTADPPDQLAAVSANDVDHYHGVGPSVQITKEISVNDGATWLPADAAPDPTLLSGYAPKFKVTVTNNGDVALTNVLVSDTVHNLTGCSFPTSLGIGASVSCLIDVTWQPGAHLSTASVSADYMDPYGNMITVTDSNVARFFGVQIGLTVLKEISVDNQVTWLDADGPGGPTLLSNGASPKYRITVQNTSNVALNTNLVDSVLVLPSECTSGMLLKDDGAPNTGSDQRVCTISGTWLSGLQTNTATASASFQDSGGHIVNVSPTDPANYFGANPILAMDIEISLDNGSTWIDGSMIPVPTLLIGVNPQFRLRLHNTGNVPIDGIDVTDLDLPLAGCESTFSLAPGFTKICNAIGSWQRGTHTFTVSFNSSYTDSAGNNWSSESTQSASFFGADPALDIVKDVSVDGGTTWLPADTAVGPYLLSGHAPPKFRLTVVNSGNVDLTVTMTDSDIQLDPACESGLLAPSGERECIITGTWTAGSHQTSAAASATFTDSSGRLLDVDDMDQAYYFGAQPAVALQFFVSGDDGTTWNSADSLPGPYFLESSNLKFKLILDNTGNVPVQSPAWSIPGFDMSACLLPPGLTPEAAAVECIITDTWKAGQVNHLASASASFIDTAANIVSPADSDEVNYFGAQPAVTIVKSTNGQDANSAPGPYILVGDTVNWTYVITNTGNVPLTEIAVTDDNGSITNTADDFNAVCGTSQLSPGEAQTCTAGGIAQPDQYVNTAGISAQPKVGDLLIGQPIASNEISHYFGARVSLTIEKSTNGNTNDNNEPGPFIKIGDPITWSFKVTNTSNIPLTNIQVWDDLGTPNNPADDRLVCTISSLAAGNANNPNMCRFTDIAVAGQYENTGTAKVTVLAKDYTASDLGHYYGYDNTQMLELSIKINDQISGNPPSVYILQDNDVDIQYTIYNFSTEFDMIVNSLTDDNGTPSDLGDDVVLCPNVHIAPQSSHACIRRLAANSGLQTHTGLVDVTVQSAQMTDSTSGSYFGVTSGITLDVHTNSQDPGGPMELPINVGDPVEWEYLIVNTSNIPLTDISILDNHTYTISCPSNILAAGAAMTCTANGFAQAGAFENDAIVRGVWPDELQAFYASAESYYYGVQGGLTLEMKVNGLQAVVPPGPDLIIGENAVLTYKVTNTGNYPVSSISVTDDLTLISCPFTSLAAGNDMTCTNEVTVTEGSTSRTAIADGIINLTPISATDKVYFTGVPPTYTVFLPLILR